VARSARDGATQVKIELPKMLLVEGESDRRFFETLLGRLFSTETIQVERYGGKFALREFLRLLQISPDYPMVDSIGVTRDADESSASAFQSVRSLLMSAGLDAPDEPMVATRGKPRVSVYVLPDCKCPGMLETLCLSAVQDDPAMPCVEQYLRCLEDSAGMPPKHPDKARAHAFLASRSKPELRVGEAAEAGHWQLDSPVFDPLKSFLLAL
jgi:hypothetical protein